MKANMLEWYVEEFSLWLACVVLRMAIVHASPKHAPKVWMVMAPPTSATLSSSNKMVSLSEYSPHSTMVMMINCVGDSCM